MAITKISLQNPPAEEQLYEESKTQTVKSQFTIADLDNQIASHTQQIEHIQAEITKLEEKKALALAVK